MSSYISASEAARRWGVSQTTVSRWLIEGRVPGAMKVSNMWLVPENVSMKDIDVPQMGRPPKESGVNVKEG